MSTEKKCPCESGKLYSQCCEPVIQDIRPAGSAEELMRSRYTAFSQQNHEYLEKSWHPETRQEIKTSEEELDKITWTGLTILNTKEGKQQHDSGIVTFVATFTSDEGEHELCEKSSFRKIDGRWYYYKGVPSRPPVKKSKINRNAACPCGSGKKFKHCCGA